MCSLWATQHCKLQHADHNSATESTLHSFAGKMDDADGVDGAATNADDTTERHPTEHGAGVRTQASEHFGRAARVAGLVGVASLA